MEQLYRDEHGLTTTGMVISLLISLALVFTGAQAYRVNSAAAEVQDVADAAVLSAENQVGEFMVIAQFCDAVVLSLSLTGLTAMGLGVAALCTPPTASLSEGLIKAGKDLIDMRDRFAERAARVLGKLQEALPYYAAACAASTAAACNASSEGAQYLGVAILVRSQGEPIEVSPADDARRLCEEIEDEADEVRRKAAEAEEAAKEANKAKERAWRRDCGDNPNYCMYERAKNLAGMSGGSNPLYSSIDTWSFSAALQRAKTYYQRRLSNESPQGSSIAEQARSVLRRQFYRYAVDTLRSGYVDESGDGFRAYFPHLPHNTAEMRTTSLYTNVYYPITVDGEGRSMMHAWRGCPNASGSTGLGSIAQMEAGDFAKCPACEFSAASMGKVAAASTSIDNGFEYHYEAVADEAARYQEAMERASEPKRAVKDTAGGFLDKLAELARETFDKRIEPVPPGRYGAIAFVVNAGTTSSAGGFASRFAADGSLGPRAALSGATLVGEDSDEGRTVINSMLDGLKRDGGAAVGAAGLVLDAWSFLMGAYTKGQESVAEAIRKTLDAIPLVGASGLGSWASDKFKKAMGDLGLQPVELRARKAVLVNSAYVAAKDDGSFGSGFCAVKQRVVNAASGASDLFGMVLNGAEQEALSRVEKLGDTVQIASIELLREGGPSIPVTIPLPEAAKSFGVASIQQLFARVRAYHGEGSGMRIWE